MTLGQVGGFDSYGNFPEFKEPTRIQPNEFKSKNDYVGTIQNKVGGGSRGGQIVISQGRNVSSMQSKMKLNGLIQSKKLKDFDNHFQKLTIKDLHASKSGYSLINKKSSQLIVRREANKVYRLKQSSLHQLKKMEQSRLGVEGQQVNNSLQQDRLSEHLDHLKHDNNALFSIKFNEESKLIKK